MALWTWSSKAFNTVMGLNGTGTEDHVILTGVMLRMAGLTIVTMIWSMIGNFWEIDKTSVQSALFPVMVFTIPAVWFSLGFAVPSAVIGNLAIRSRRAAWGLKPW